LEKVNQRLLLPAVYFNEETGPTVRSDHLKSAVRSLWEPDRDLVARPNVTARRDNTHNPSLSYQDAVRITFQNCVHEPCLIGVQLYAGVSQAGDPDYRSLAQLKQRFPPAALSARCRW
jgi:hypothetical protein